MQQNPPDDTATPGHNSLAWPVDLLTTQSRDRSFVGFLMKKISGGSSVSQYALPGVRSKKHPHFDFRYLHTAAANIASAFDAVHRAGYVIGDVNESNILVTDVALASIVDTDSFQVPSQVTGGVYRCGVGRPEFTPPELQGFDFSTVDREVQHDLFGLAIIIFRLLMQGHHPYNGEAKKKGVDGWRLDQRISKGNFPFGRSQSPFSRPRYSPNLTVLPPEIRDLFVTCFEDGKHQPTLRPAAATWKRALREASDKLIQCLDKKLHLYGKHLGGCPWCEIERQYGFDPFEVDPEFLVKHKSAAPSKTSRGLSPANTHRSLSNRTMHTESLQNAGVRLLYLVKDLMQERSHSTSIGMLQEPAKQIYREVGDALRSGIPEDQIVPTIFKGWNSACTGSMRGLASEQLLKEFLIVLYGEVEKMTSSLPVN
ncbi:MAG: hypothetical protein H0X01_01810 [Nitrospira sp.]|nr:hypothetical protein [Nitrospira sp.]